VTYLAIKIYIDQGHNPQNPNAGAEGNGYREQDITFAVGIELAALLLANPDFEVKLSRPTSETVLGTSNATSLAARTSEANSWGADYFISIHANASDIQTALGSEAYVYSLPSVAGDLAQDIVNSIALLTSIPERGVFARPSLYVLRKTTMPAVLVELGFITTKSEAEKMANQPELYAAGIYDGILNYLGKIRSIG
jgi:N-acetylmuramoyl-L-alanine amidase